MVSTLMRTKFKNQHFVLTCNPEINVLRVKNRVLVGGHDVPVEKILLRYTKSLNMIK